MLPQDPHGCDSFELPINGDKWSIYIQIYIYIEEYCIWATGDLNAIFFYFHSNWIIRVCGRGIKREWEDKGTQKEEKKKER